MKDIISFIHVITIIYQLFYPIIFNNYFYDIVYILFFYVTLLSYILLKGECIISLCYKIITNNKYELGTDIFELNDIQDILPFHNNKFTYAIYSIIPIYYFYELFKLNKRTKALPIYNFYIFIICFVFYISYLRKFFNERLFNKYKVENYIQFFYILSIPFLLYSIYLLLQKLWRSKNKKM
jgi:hypothetical protein